MRPRPLGLLVVILIILIIIVVVILWMAGKCQRRGKVTSFLGLPTKHLSLSLSFARFAAFSSTPLPHHHPLHHLERIHRLHRHCP